MARPKSHGARGAKGFLDKVKKPYQRALAWVRAPLERRAPLSRSAESEWRRIADLGDMGAHLDAIGAPYYVARWVAAPGRRRARLREERYRAAITALARGPWSNAKWRALCDSSPGIHGKDKQYVRPGCSKVHVDDELDFGALLEFVAQKAA